MENATRQRHNHALIWRFLTDIIEFRQGTMCKSKLRLVIPLHTECHLPIADFPMDASGLGLLNQLGLGQRYLCRLMNVCRTIL